MIWVDPYQPYRGVQGAEFYARAYPPIDDDEIMRGVGRAPATSEPTMGLASPTAAMGPGPAPAALVERLGDSMQIPFTIGTDSVPILPPPPGGANRIFLEVQVYGASPGTVYVSTGTPATTSNGVELPPGATKTWSTFVPQNAVHIIGTAADTQGVLSYSNKKADD